MGRGVGGRIDSVVWCVYLSVCVCALGWPLSGFAPLVAGSRLVAAKPAITRAARQTRRGVTACFTAARACFTTD